ADQERRKNAAVTAILTTMIRARIHAGFVCLATLAPAYPYLSKAFEYGLNNLYDPVVDHAVCGNQPVWVLNGVGAIFQWFIRNIRHTTACFPENGFRAASVPYVRTVSCVDVYMSAAFA